MLFFCVYVFLISFSVSYSSEVTELDIFLIPHSHIDQGWLYEIKKYESSVRVILDRVTSELEKKKDRRFNWGELYYFKSWYESIGSKKKKTIRMLISEGRFSFVHGAWIQNDEACPTITAIIDQLTYGVNFLFSEFGIENYIAWQIDPFGHDQRMVEILSNMGFKAVVLNRIHYKIKELMRKENLLEFIWESRTSKKSIFSHVLYNHYSSPTKSFDFERPLKTPEKITEENIEERSEELVKYFLEVSESYRSTNIMVPIGDDFRFYRPLLQFENWDKLISHINKKYDFIKIRYSTVHEYLDHLSNSQQQNHFKFPIINQDIFLPYMDDIRSYWSGYYATYPTLKHKIRESENWKFHVEIACVIEMGLSQKTGKFKKQIQEIREEVGVAQHHDYITGTARKSVIKDYMERLGKTIEKSKTLVSEIITNILLKPTSSRSSKLLQNHLEYYDPHCFSQPPLKIQKKKIFYVFNSGVSEVDQLVHLKTESPNIRILLGKNHSPSQQQITSFSDKKTGKMNYDLFLKIPIKRGLSLTKFEAVVSSSSSSIEEEKNSDDENILVSDDDDSYSTSSTDHFSFDELGSLYTIENYFYRIQLDLSSSSFSLKISDLNSNSDHLLFGDILQFFKTSTGGAYIFRPGRIRGFRNNKIEKLFLSKGNIFSQMKIYTRYYTVIFMLFNCEVDGSYIHVELDIPEIEEYQEYVFRVPLKKEGKLDLFSFDGVNFSPRDFGSNFGMFPLAGNFFPAPLGAVAGHSQGNYVSVLNSASQGVSVVNGELVFLIHRRLMKDDSRGLSFPNNDTSKLNTKFFIRYDNLKRSKKEDRDKLFCEIRKSSSFFQRKNPVFVLDSEENSEDFYEHFQVFGKENSKILSGEMISLEVLENKEIGLRLIGGESTDLKDFFFKQSDRMEKCGLSYTSIGNVKKTLEREEFMTVIELPRSTIFQKLGLGYLFNFGKAKMKRIHKNERNNNNNNILQEISTWKIRDWKIDQEKCFLKDEVNIQNRKGLINFKMFQKRKDSNGNFVVYFYFFVSILGIFVLAFIIYIQRKRLKL